MLDGMGREINYMRVSITDRCNLRCKYCMPEDLPSIGHEQILRYEEILRICRAAASLGISHFKVTGGEPLVRKGVEDFLARLRRLPGVEGVTITTNGVLLEPLIPVFSAMGISGVNISLDTLNRESYRRLTGQDALPDVLRSLESAVAAGLKVKINCVAMEGINQEELGELAALGGRLPVDVRFIELMPTEAGCSMGGVPGKAVREKLLEHYPDLRPAQEQRGMGPAKYYQSDRLLGRIGFIDALTGHFCAGCNRIRLTSEGFLKLCLYHDDGVSLRELLRDGMGDDELRQIMEKAIGKKPERHHFTVQGAEGGIRGMSGIGG